MAHKKAADRFPDSRLKAARGAMAFNPGVWGKLLDHATVYTDDSIRFTFRNGIEI